MNDDSAMGGPFGEIAMAPDIVKAGEIGVVIFLARQDHSRTSPASTGTAWCRRARPSVGGRACPLRLKTSTAMPSVGAWISPRQTGASGLPATKQPQISVPPEIDARCRSDFIRLIDEIETFRRQGRARGAHGAQACQADGYPSGASRSCARRRCIWRMFRKSSCLPRRQNRRAPVHWDKRASRHKARSVPPAARPETSQFHIIQPQVVK